MAITTKTDLANYALAKLNAGSIDDISGTEREAELCNLFIDDAIELCLREDEWVFAIKRDDSLVSGTAIDPWDYAFALPSDCLRVLDFYSESPFLREGALIYTNDDDPNLRYLYRNENISSWTAEFREVVALRLAHMVAFELTQDEGRQARMYQEYQVKLYHAKNMNGMEREQPAELPDQWSDR